MNSVFEQDATQIEGYRQLFVSTMQYVSRVFPYGFRKNAMGNATPRARFEAIAIGSRAALAARPDLVEMPPDRIDVEAWISSEEFTEVTGSDGANAIARLRGRIGYVEQKLVSV
jgi:hypothetical protein